MLHCTITSTDLTTFTRSGDYVKYRNISALRDKWTIGNTYIDDRQILKVEIIDGRSAGLISGTAGVYLDLDAFMNSKYNKILPRIPHLRIM